MDSQPLSLTVRAVAELVGGSVEGDGSVTIAGLGSVESAGAGELTFALDEKRAGRLANSKAAAAIVGKVPATAPMPLIRVQNVPAALIKLLDHLNPGDDLPGAGVHPSAVIAPGAQVAPDAAIGPNVAVGAGSSIGPGAVLCANVAVGSDVQIGEQTVLAEGVVVRSHSRIGKRVRIGPNSVIGEEGFGYFTMDGVHHKIPHIGNVVIEDDVEIGACSCVDRAKFGSTRVGAGTKIDNLVQVAHNVQVGRGCILVGQCGIAGSTRLGDYVVIGGHAGIRDNITLGNGAQCAAYAGVASDVPDGQVVAGTPAGPARHMYRVWQATEKLPDLLKRVKNLEARLSALESPKDH